MFQKYTMVLFGASVFLLITRHFLLNFGYWTIYNWKYFHIIIFLKYTLYFICFAYMFLICYMKFEFINIYLRKANYIAMADRRSIEGTLFSSFPISKQPFMLLVFSFYSIFPDTRYQTFSVSLNILMYQIYVWYMNIGFLSSYIPYHPTLVLYSQNDSLLCGMWDRHRKYYKKSMSFEWIIKCFLIIN